MTYGLAAVLPMILHKDKSLSPTNTTAPWSDRFSQKLSKEKGCPHRSELKKRGGSDRGGAPSSKRDVIEICAPSSPFDLDCADSALWDVG